VLGIDLGTTNTCVAYVRNHVAKVVPTDRGNTTLPSVVALAAGGEMLVGEAAKSQMLTNPRNSIYGAKRLIGRAFRSRVVQELRGKLPYEIVAGPKGEAAVRLGDKVYTLPQISSFVLAHIKTIAEQALDGPVDEVVISAPAYYNDNQRNAVKEAGRLAGLKVRRIVNEPTAAALAYGFNRGLDQKILVYDLGGGTFDVSVLNLEGNVFEVLATGGDTFLGGSDFDHRIVEYALEQFRLETKVDLQESPVAMQRLELAAEAAKMDLSLIPNVVIELPSILEKKGRQLDLRIPLSRERLHALTSDLVDRTFALCHQVLATKGISPREIAEVILVGGQSRMPLVQEKVREHFGRPARKGVHPDECVAQGAALLADSLGTLDSLTLVDVLSMPIGYAALGSRFRKILERNSSIPCSRSFRLPPPPSGATEIVMDIFQGESEQVVDNEYLGTLKFDKSLAGRKIDFRLSEECLLSVVIDHPQRGVLPVELATRDTPEAIKAALSADDLRRTRERDVEAAPKAGGLFSSIRRIWST
jgi:molecular chaperone DnaK